MNRFQHFAAVAVGVSTLSLSGLPPAVVVHAAAPFCTTEDAPALDDTFANLKAALGDQMADPTDCAHSVLNGADMVQHLGNGAVVFDLPSGVDTFTDGSQFWNVADDGTPVSSTQAPDGVLPALLAAPDQPSAPPAAQPAAQSATQPVAPSATLSDADIAARITPSVVQVLVPNGSGTGIVVAGGVLTDEHVIHGASSIQVVTSTGQKLAATVSRSSQAYDLALLSVSTGAPALDIETSDLQRQGDPVLVFGFPLGSDLPGASNQPTLTRGLLSGTRQQNGLVYEQTDAAMNPGNSGGPMVNNRGKVIGLSQFVVNNTQGLNFGIAGESILSFLNGPGGLAASNPAQAVYLGDPRALAPTLNDLHSGSEWQVLGDDTSQLQQGAYNIGFGKLQVSISNPGNGATPTFRTYADPILSVTILEYASVADAKADWAQIVTKLDPGEKVIQRAQIADDQLYAQENSFIELRVRQRNVIVLAQVITSGEKPIYDTDVVQPVTAVVQKINSKAS